MRTYRFLFMFVAIPIIGACLGTEAAEAQRQRQRAPVAVERPAHKLEVSAFGGYGWTGGRSFCLLNSCGDLDIGGAGLWGVAVDVIALPTTQVEFLYSRQDSELKWDPALAPETTVSDVAVEYWHAGVLRGLPRGKLFPFGSVSLGATHFAYDSRALDDDWKFSVIVSGGVKYYASERIGLRMQARLPMTMFSGGAGIGCGLGGCYTSVGGTGIAQFDMLAGVAILL